MKTGALLRQGRQRAGTYESIPDLLDQTHAQSATYHPETALLRWQLAYPPLQNRGDRMTALDDNWYTSDQLEDDTGQPVLASGEYKLPEASSRPSSTTGAWKVEVRLHAHLVSRQVSYRNQPWFPGQVGPVPDGQRTGEVIWPTWPASVDEEIATSCTPLADLQRHWDESISRMRDSAKWMAAVLGAALASVVPTAPLTGRHHVSRASAVLGVGGLAFLAITMLLILRVMRPNGVLRRDPASRGPVRLPREAVRPHPAPRGPEINTGQPALPVAAVRRPASGSVSALRRGLTHGSPQPVTVEEMTLVALARARENATGGAIRKKLTDAQAAPRRPAVRTPRRGRTASSPSACTTRSGRAARSRHTWEQR